MHDLNLWAALLAAVLSFVLGGIWYSPLTFGKPWMREAHIRANQSNSTKTFAISFLFAVVAALGFAYLLGPKPELQQSIHMALLVGIAFVAASYGVNYQFSQKSFLLLAIDGGYHVAQFLIYAVILAVWH